jgi:phosphate binding protein
VSGIEFGGGPAEVGSSFGTYQLIANLGRGGMADVFLAVARGPAGFNKLIVIKRLRAELAEDTSFREMFLDEARLAARLNHPNVVHTYEVGETDGAYFIAMEYLEGQPLQNLDKASKAKGLPLPAEVATRIIADALAGLHYAHELRDYDGSPLGIVHRDVSPHNLFVTYDGQVKLVDFGIAKASSSSNETQAGVLKGKAAYMAPEQAKGARVDRRSDIFAMGIVLWELCVGQRLMLRESSIATIHRLLSEPIPRPSDVVPGFPLELDAIIMCALQHHPDDRYATASDMRGALSNWLATRPMAHDELEERMKRLFARARAEMEKRIQTCMQGNATETGALARITMTVRDGTETPSSHLSANRGAPSDASASRSMGASGASASSIGSAPPAEDAKTPPAKRSVARTLASLGGLGVLAVLGGAAVLSVVRKDAATGASGASAATSGTTSSATIPAPASEVLLRLHGSNTIGAELGPALAEAYLKAQGATEVARSRGLVGSDVTLVVGKRPGKPDAAIEVAAAGSQTAFEDLETKKCDIGMSSRPIKVTELERALKAGLGDLTGSGSEHVLGLDGIAAVVHPANPVRSLTTVQLRLLFDGEVTDWLKVGAPAGPVSILARDDRSGTFDTWKHLVMGDTPIVPTAKRFAESDKLSEAVAADPSAVGFIGLAYVKNARAVAVAEPGSSPLFPSRFTIASEDYALTRRLFLYTPARGATPAGLEFVTFALSPAGQKVVSDAGFVDLTIRLRDPEPCAGKCPARYLELSKKARRLSLDFRFRKGSTALDSRGERDVDRLLAFLKDRPSPHVYLLGFADGQADGTKKDEVSKARAHAVEEELAAHGVRAQGVLGFGSEMPVASNATEAGRDRNRRVEVWLANE